MTDDRNFAQKMGGIAGLTAGFVTPRVVNKFIVDFRDEFAASYDAVQIVKTAKAAERQIERMHRQREREMAKAAKKQQREIEQMNLATANEPPF
jgi:hypothetical protein